MIEHALKIATKPNARHEQLVRSFQTLVDTLDDQQVDRSIGHFCQHDTSVDLTKVIFKLHARIAGRGKSQAETAINILKASPVANRFASIIPQENQKSGVPYYEPPRRISLEELRQVMGSDDSSRDGAGPDYDYFVYENANTNDIAKIKREFDTYPHEAFRYR